jgi:hypothetical protein
MFTIVFWKATLERMIRAGAASVLSFWVVGDGILNAANVDWQSVLGVFGGGAVVSLLLSLSGQAATGNGPALTGVEVTNPPEPNA